MSAPDAPPTQPGLTSAPSGLDVGGELEQIFRGSAIDDDGRPYNQVIRTSLRNERPRQAAPAAIAGIVAAAALAGISAGTLFGRSAPAQGEMPAPAPATAPVEPAAVSAALAPTPPAPGPGWRIPDGLAPSGLATTAPASSMPSARLAAPSSKRVTPAVRKRAPQVAARHRTVTDCGRGDGGAWCAHLAVMAADARLRRAYAGAIQRGAPRSELIRRREEWSSLRRRALRDPAEVVEGYTAIAQRLERESS